MVLRVLKPFDPWKSELCTCGRKYSLNPYTGCYHSCLYCYASSYIKNFFFPRAKRNFVKMLERDAEEADKGVVVSISNSTDPYQPLEKKHMLTRKSLEILREHDFKVLVVTKSDLVARDIDVLSSMRCAVSITITGRSGERLETRAPPMERRIEAIIKLYEAGIPVILRLDPLIPWAEREEWKEVIYRVSSYVSHVVTSTLKLRRDSVRRLSIMFPKELETVLPLYKEKYSNYLYLKKEVRKSMLEFVEDVCRELGISCAFCREGFKFKAKSCDGTHLIK